jgi:hypothetical protein
MRHLNLILLALCSLCVLSCSDAKPTEEEQVLAQCKPQEYVPFRYVDFNSAATGGSEPYLILGKPVVPKGVGRVIFVLEFYGIPYRVTGNTVEVLCKTWRDKDMLANLAKKARSRSWLELQGYAGALDDLKE